MLTYNQVMKIVYLNPHSESLEEFMYKELYNMYNQSMQISHQNDMHLLHPLY